MRSELVRLFQTLPHPCGYYADRIAQNLVIDPACEHLPNIYEAALAKGFRRAGGHVYRPHCGTCRACIAARIPAVDFVPDRSQRRCIKRNADLAVDIVRAGGARRREDGHDRERGPRGARRHSVPA